MRLLPLRVSCIAALAGMVIAAPAWADSIDGHWCNGSGLHLRIQGTAIETPSGNVISGEYDRHAFRYIAPEGEPDAGSENFLQLLSEERMLLYRGMPGSGDDGEEWRRCEVTS